jgi:hypothetical protein
MNPVFQRRFGYRYASGSRVLNAMAIDAARHYDMVPATLRALAGVRFTLLGTIDRLAIEQAECRVSYAAMHRLEEAAATLPMRIEQFKREALKASHDDWASAGDDEGTTP